MGLFRRNGKTGKEKKSYDREKQAPVIHSSICTGEKVAGFKDLETGKFEEVACLKSDADLEDFLEAYGIDRSEVKTEY